MLCAGLAKGVAQFRRIRPGTRNWGLSRLVEQRPLGEEAGGRWRSGPRTQATAFGLGLCGAFLALCFCVGQLANDPGPVKTSPPAKPAAQRSQALQSVVPPATFEQVTPEQAALLNASLPFSTAPNPAAEPFAFKPLLPTDRARALTCLTMAVYYEAANQGADGEAAVAQVVLNRVRNPLFPKTVCGVVFQGAEHTGCQFTFACDGSLARRPSVSGWKAAAGVAERALGGYVVPTVGEATHYHTMWVVPTWRLTVTKITQLGAHIFYRWDGALGDPGSFRGAYAGAEPPPPAMPGFDTGFDHDVPPKLLTIASVATAQPAPQVDVPVVEQEALVGLTKVADLEAPAAASLSKPPNPGYFGHAPSAPQRLPVPSNW